MEDIYFEEGEYFLWTKDREGQESPLTLSLQMIREKYRSGKKQAMIAKEVNTEKYYFLKILFCSEIEQVFVEKESKVQLYCPFIIRIYGGMLDEKNKRFITVMEYLPEYDLSDMMREKGLAGDDWKEKIFSAHKIALRFLYGIEHYMTVYEHDPYIHRDLKPENVLASPDGNLVKIIDFDWVHLHESHVTVYSGRKQKGTAGYTDPRYWNSSVSKKEMDIYSAGLVLFFLYTGHHHFTGNDEIQRYMSEPGYAYTLKAMPGIDDELRAIIAKMIAPEEQRYHQIEDVIRDLENYLKKQSIQIHLPEMVGDDEKGSIRFSYKVGDIKYSPYVKNYRFVPIEFGTRQLRSHNGENSGHILSFYRMDDKMKVVILHDGCVPIRVANDQMVSVGDVYLYAGTKIEIVQIRYS